MSGILDDSTNAFAVWVLVILIPCATYPNVSMNSNSHIEKLKEWARTGESAEASLRVKRYKAAFEARLRGVMRSQDYPAWLRLLGNTSLLIDRNPNACFDKLLGTTR